MPWMKKLVIATQQPPIPPPSPSPYFAWATFSNFSLMFLEAGSPFFDGPIVVGRHRRLLLPLLLLLFICKFSRAWMHVYTKQIVHVYGIIWINQLEWLGGGQQEPNGGDRPVDELECKEPDRQFDACGSLFFQKLSRISWDTSVSIAGFYTTQLRSEAAKVPSRMSRGCEPCMYFCCGCELVAFDILYSISIYSILFYVSSIMFLA